MANEKRKNRIAIPITVYPQTIGVFFLLVKKLTPFFCAINSSLNGYGLNRKWAGNIFVRKEQIKCFLDVFSLFKSIKRLIVAKQSRLVYSTNIMPKKNHKSVKTVVSKITENPSVTVKAFEPSKRSVSLFRKVFTVRNSIVIGILIVILLVWRFRGFFIVSTVNGEPISRLELYEVLSQRYGSQTLDNMISERLILAGTRQKGVFVTSQEIDSKEKEIEERLKGSMTLKDALAAQGMTEPMFRKQVEIQLAVDKMFTQDSTVSSKEVDDYISQNAETYKNATDPAATREEVTGILKQQKVSDLFEKWFTELRQSAKIEKSI